MTDEPIAEFMNRDVLSGPAGTPLFEVIVQMSALNQSEFVVCENERPIGMITERDVVVVLKRSLSGEDFGHATAGDIMASPVGTLLESSPMGDVIRMMNERRFRRVPITNEEEELIGVVNLLDLQFAMNTALERRGRNLEVAVMERTAELMKANQKLEELSIRDGLTGLLNRRAMSDRLDELHALTNRRGNPYAVILIDIDHFKNYNDSLGHVQGDEAIRAISKLLEDTIRVYDTVYRYGGEEFLIAMPETDANSASVVAERIRSAVEHASLPHPQSSVGDVVTLSLGFAVVDEGNAKSYERWEQVIEAADDALYRAKQGGRNRVMGPTDRT